MVDVLLATYNGAAYLQELLDSLLAQEFQGWRLLVRDDGSSDNTSAILESQRVRLGNRLTILSDDGGNLGPCGNFARLLQASDADYAMLCDQDDVWLPGKISLTLDRMRQLEAESGKTTPLLVHTDFRVVDENLALLAGSGWRYQKIDPRRTALNQLLVQNAVTGCTVMVNRALRTSALPMPGEALMHDYWLALVAAAFGRIGSLPVPTVLYRQHGCNQVGAHRQGVLILRHLFDLPAIRRVMTRNRMQAKAFYWRFQTLLDTREREMLTSFTDLAERGRLQRRVDIFRHGFFYSGAIRNIGWLLLC